VSGKLSLDARTQALAECRIAHVGQLRIGVHAPVLVHVGDELEVRRALRALAG